MVYGEYTLSKKKKNCIFKALSNIIIYKTVHSCRVYFYFYFNRGDKLYDFDIV